MSDITRKYSEIVSIAKFEPGLKNVYVEGLSDRYFINTFLNYHKIRGVVVYDIDTVDFSELYKNMEEEEAARYRASNKERVVLLAKSLERDLNNAPLSTLCIVDVDWDNVLNEVRTGLYLAYTDYNSMDMYLFAREVIECYLKQGLRISSVNVANLMDSLMVLCRQLFHVHCLMHENKKQIVDNTKDVSFDKTEQVCHLDFSEYWRKTLAKTGLTARSEELLALFNSRIIHQCDNRMEMRGHDFVCFLYFCAKKMKSNMKMDEDEFANMFWQFANNEALAHEPLFQRVMNL